jgi:hypothetical protein
MLNKLTKNKNIMSLKKYNPIIPAEFNFLCITFVLIQQPLFAGVARNNKKLSSNQCYSSIGYRFLVSRSFSFPSIVRPKK